MLNIIKGHLKEILNLEEELSKSRLAICENCPLYKNDSLLGIICSTQIYVDTLTGKTSTYPKKGYRCGCGCRLDAKTRLKDELCPLNKWNNIK